MKTVMIVALLASSAQAAKCTAKVLQFTGKKDCSGDPVKSFADSDMMEISAEVGKCLENERKTGW